MVLVHFNPVFLSLPYLTIITAGTRLGSAKEEINEKDEICDYMLIWLFRPKMRVNGIATHVLKRPRQRLHGTGLHNVGHTYMHTMISCYHKNAAINFEVM